MLDGGFIKKKKKSRIWKQSWNRRQVSLVTFISPNPNPNPIPIPIPIPNPLPKVHPHPHHRYISMNFIVKNTQPRATKAMENGRGGGNKKGESQSLEGESEGRVRVELMFRLYLD